MNKSKIFLSAVATIAVVGGAFALKSSKISGTGILLDSDQDGICTEPAVGFKATTYLTAYSYGYVTVTNTEIPRTCARAYYLTHP